jgi:RHS repeat-associated protein
MVGDSTFTTFASGSSTVTKGPLGTFDPTLLLNGLYVIQLTATDVSGRSSTISVTVVVQGDQKVGQLSLQFVDLIVPVAGVPLNVVRTYDSRDKTQGDFGFGWTLSVKEGSYTNNTAPGNGWEIQPGDFGLPCLATVELQPHVTVIQLSDDEEYTFRVRYSNITPTIGGCLATAGFSFVSGFQSGAQLQILGNTSVLYQDGTDQVLDANTFQPYDPTQVRLTTVDGRVFDLDEATGVTRIQDANANVLTIGPAGLTHSSGKSIQFQRDQLGRIVSVTDPTGAQVLYAYDAAGDLTQVTNQVGATTTFGYSTAPPHLLTTITGPDGKTVAALGYDPTGRLVRQCDANAACTEVQHDLQARREVVTDPTGRTSIYTYDQQGNVLTFTDGLGNTTSFAYDSNSNLVSQVDPNGGLTRYTYDGNGNLLSVTAPHSADSSDADFTTSYTYDSRNALTSVTLPSGSKIFIQHDTAGNETALVDSKGNVLHAFAYDSAGAVVSERTPFWSVTQVNDSAGNPVQSTGPFSDTYSMAYDADSQLTSMTDQQGVAEHFQYDAAGRMTSADYGDGVSASWGYGYGAAWTQVSGPTLGKLQRKLTVNGELGGWTLPNGADSTYVYDAAGRVVQSNEPLGNTTTYHYDAAGRLDTITDSQGGKRTYQYDAAGNIIKQTDAMGNSTSYTYTPDGHVASMTDARGQTWTFTYSPTTFTQRDPLGRTTTTTYSPEGLPIQQTNPDGRSETVTYVKGTLADDASSRPTSLTDEEGRTRSFTYNAAGQLATATDLGGNAYTYAYSGADIVSVTGPTNATVSYTHDRLHNLTSVTDPGGGVTTYRYGSNNLVQSETRPSSTTVSYQYDAAGQLISRSASTGENVQFTRNAYGALTTVQSANGLTSYTYDTVGNVTRINYPGGARVDYAYDLLGRVAAMTSQANSNSPAYATRYTYDANGNLTSVTDPLGGHTSMVYDAVKRLVQRQLPNGVTSTFTYNNEDQVTSITHLRPDGSVLASFQYQRGPSGEPTRITREDGSYVVLGYDSAWRLTSETYFDKTGAVVQSISYAYDAAGNRVTRSDQSETRTYSYAAGYELTASQGANGSEAYSYDADGRVTSITRDGTTRSLTYDSQDRLTGVTNQANGSDVTYQYDGEGRRVGLVDSSGATQFVVGPTAGNDTLESPLLALDSTGALLSGYVYVGGQPLMRFGPDGPTYYLTDAVGSVISLADGAGSSIANFRYDGFGNALPGSTLSLPAAGGGDFRFQGAWLDADSGFYHFPLRDYDPHVGRFLSKDPAGLNPEQPESLNPYSFEFGNPEAYRDPTGGENLITINISLDLEKTLDTIETWIVDQAKKTVRQKIRQAIGAIIGTAINTLVPEAPLLTDYIDGERAANARGRGSAGFAFDQALQDILCPTAIQAVWPTALWLEVSMEYKGANAGKPLANGINCSAEGGVDFSGLVKKFGKPRPDFLFSNYPPTKLNKTERSLLVGDFKVSAAAMVKKYVGGSSQFDAIVGHANNWSYSRVALFISWNDTNSEQYAQVQKAFFDKGVVAIFVSISAVGK